MPYQHNTALAIASNQDNLGLSKQYLLAQFTSEWNLHVIGTYEISGIYKRHVISYSRVHVTGPALRNMISDGGIANAKDSRTYAVIYYKCTPEQCFAADTVALSYRATSVGNFVLATPLN